MYDLQKPNIWKRISAYLFDLILICIAIVGFALLISNIIGYDAYLDELEVISDAYETEYNVDFNIPTEEYDKLTPEEKEPFIKADEAFSKDERANYVYGMIINCTFIIIVFGILLGFLVFEFVVPLILKNGQTLGKKVFGVGVMREDGVKITPMLLFIRTVLGKYTVETMIPVLLLIMVYLGVIDIVGIIVILGIFVAQLAFIFTTRTRTALHDVISRTVTVDIASQMIFDTPEALLAYKQKIHEEAVNSEKE